MQQLQIFKHLKTEVYKPEKPYVALASLYEYIFIYLHKYVNNTCEYIYENYVQVIYIQRCMHTGISFSH